MVWQDYIISDKNILIGKPTIKGTRISIELILDLLSSGWTEQQLLESYPQLTTNHIKAVFSYLRNLYEKWTVCVINQRRLVANI
ncbi:DUF433 domain-containing protein (plasmid) [Pedobacter sp. BS3]|uniref:DUF433 domain-containing protein n=1 Tax=Pedobacter sp. BS3 TaxID=2567937 RepID=UPI0011ECA94F|nr:DUF433 domain-containing protein [Pedobacter sp. BS3]TZF86382.1 DUF433 domain-containing protein [Pedobacter sp. BS3]